MEEKNMRPNKMICPNCGSDKLQITTETNTQTTGKNYSSGQGCLGYLMFGPLGLLCGSCGQKQKTTVTHTNYWVCSHCGNKFRNPNDIKADISKYIKFSSLPLLLVLCLFGAFFIGIGVWLEASPLILFGIIYIIVCTLVCIVRKAVTIPKLKRELAEIEDGMNRFRR